VRAMESGELSIYPTMREMAATFGVPDLARAAIAKMKSRATEKRDGGASKKSGLGLQNAMMAILMMELSRCCPGFALAVGASPGVTTSKPFAKMGMHASPTGEVFLDDVFVPEDQVLGGDPAERGEDAASRDERNAARASLSNERFGMTPMCLGILDRCLEESVRYAKERTQWGRPMASFQLVQEKIARMYTARSITQTLLLRQLEADAQGVPLRVEE